MIKSGIYKITDIVNGRFYIGSSVNIDKRYKFHFRRLRQNNHHNVKLQNAWNSHGEENFKVEVIEYVENTENLLEREQYYLDTLLFAQEYINNKDKRFQELGYNNYAETKFINYGYKHRNSVKQKISETMTGNIKRSPETRVKMSLAAKKREQLKKENNLKTKTIKKTSSHRGNKQRLERIGSGSSSAKKVAQYDLSTGELLHVFLSAREAAFALGRESSSAIRNLAGGKLAGRAKSAHGYDWKYITNEEYNNLKTNKMERKNTELTEGLRKLASLITEYKSTYDSTLLETIQRDLRRKEYTAPINGIDVWTAFEVSYLLETGLPQYTVIRIFNPANSTYIFESKSLKLYLNSFNNTKFKNKEQVFYTIELDLSNLVKAKVKVEELKDEDAYLNSLEFYKNTFCLDNLTPVINTYTYDKSLLKKTNKTRSGEIKLYSNLLRSNCELSNQPDWARIFISYSSDEEEIDEESLLKYIVSFRNHQEFHEPTCERIYNDLFELLKVRELTVICQYTRRGGIDINPVRSTSLEKVLELATKLPKLLQQ